HPNYIGDVGIGINPKLAARIRESDYLLVIGARLGEMTTSGYTLIDIPVPKQTMVHIHPDPEELGRVYQPTLGITSSPGPLAAALAQLEPLGNPAWQAWTEAARKDYDEARAIPRSPGKLQMGEIMQWLNDNLPENTVVCNGAGNFSTWVHRFYQYKGFGTQLA